MNTPEKSIFFLEQEYRPDLPLIEDVWIEDQNEWRWRMENYGSILVLSFHGDSHFFENLISVTTDDKHFMVRNTNRIVFTGVDADDYFELRDLIINGYTDEVWEAIEVKLYQRLNKEPKLLQSEEVKRTQL